MSDDSSTATTRSGARCKNQAQPGSASARPPDTRRACRTERSRTPDRVENPTPGAGDENWRQEMAAEIDNLIEELQETTPASPPPFSPRALVELVRQSLDNLPPGMRVDVLYRLRDALQRDDVETWRGVWYLMHYWRYYQDAFVSRLRALSLEEPLAALKRVTNLIEEGVLDMDTLKGAWFMLSYSLKYQADFVRRRFTGEYDTDPWGLDWELLEAVRPIFTFLYKVYWRVQANGLEHIPDYERALIVANHSGQLPFDGAMIAGTVMLEHPSQRLVRNLYADWFPSLPFLAPFLEKMGQSLASVENGTALLSNDELVAVYPEGYKGVGKLYKERYRLARFGRGGFVRMALNTQAPIIPTAVVGAEETYISLYKSNRLARLTGFPTSRFPTWPWLVC